MKTINDKKKAKVLEPMDILKMQSLLDSKKYEYNPLSSNAIPGIKNIKSNVYLVNTEYRGHLDMQYTTKEVVINVCRKPAHGAKEWFWHCSCFDPCPKSRLMLFEIQDMLEKAENMALAEEVDLESPIDEYGMGGYFSWEEGRWISSSENC